MISPDAVKTIFDKTCLTKSNLTEEAANHVVDRAAMEGLLLYFYKCMFCGSFHMTKKPGDVENRLDLK